MLVQGVHILNPVLPLRNYSYLSSLDFTSTTNLYGWHLNGAGSFSGAGWIGGTDLTQVGSPTTSTNKIDETTYCQFDGSSSAAYVNTTDFDTSNESFTVGGWVYFNNLTGNKYVISKYGGSHNSFYLYRTSTGQLQFDIYYNSGSTSGIRTADGIVASSQWYHIVMVYDQSTTSATLVINGKVVGYVKDSNLATRYNGNTSTLYIGGRTSYPETNGKFMDVFYQKSAMSLSQIRRLYVTGTKLSAYTDENGKTKINGENLGDYWIQYDRSATGLITGTSSWVTTFGILLPRKTPNSIWLDFQICGRPSTTTSCTITLVGVTFKSGSGRYQSASQTQNSGVGSAYPLDWQIGGGSSSIQMTYGAAHTYYQCGGSVELDSWPAWALDLSTIY